VGETHRKTPDRALKIKSRERLETYSFHPAKTDSSVWEVISLAMLPISLLLQWSTNERPSDDSAKLSTTARTNRAAPGSRAARFGDNAPPGKIGAALAASAAASFARSIGSVCDNVKDSGSENN
jgi:hypothetical protein